MYLRANLDTFLAQSAQDEEEKERLQQELDEQRDKVKEYRLLRRHWKRENARLKDELAEARRAGMVVDLTGRAAVYIMMPPENPKRGL